MLFLLAANRPSDKTALYLRTIRSIVPLHYAGTMEWILFTLRPSLMLDCCISNLFIAATELQTKMNEAEDYLTVNPAHSLSLLDAIGPISAPAEDALRWHILSMRAAVPTNQLEHILTSLAAGADADASDGQSAAITFAIVAVCGILFVF